MSNDYTVTTNVVCNFINDRSYHISFTHFNLFSNYIFRPSFSPYESINQCNLDIMVSISES